MPRPFAIPRRLSPSLDGARAYWRRLLRGAAPMPFGDDVRIADLGDLADSGFLIDVFEKPERFRLQIIGARIPGQGLAGLFIDEASLASPLNYLRSQCSATVEAAAPTWFEEKARSSSSGYSRLLLPTWGDGRIGMLLGVVDFS